jgi:ABC-type Fe3+-siderophore transport system permease subunit
MLGGARTLVMLVVAVLPGGLLMLAAWILGRVVRTRMQEVPGEKAARLVRAVALVRWRDVWVEARHAVSPHG